MYAEPADAWNHSKSAAGAVQSQASQVVAPLGAWLRVTCGDLLGHGRVVGDAGVPAARAATFCHVCASAKHSPFIVRG